MIYYFTPFLKKNLGLAYNHYCELVPNDEDWITFMDGDVMQLHTNWGDIWSNIISKNNNAGIITCLSNRIHKTNKDQLCLEMFNETDIIQHTKYARKLFQENGYNTKIMNGNFLSGYFFSFKKQTWKDVGGFIDGILNVDANFYQKVKKHYQCLVAKGFYILHYYRMLEDYRNGEYTNHLT